MPVSVSYPGVYIQEVSSGVRTITGVATSIAAFFGRTPKGPINKAVRCLSYSDFLRNFGGAHPNSDLAASVAQFFLNGGTDCYVVRLAHGAMKAATALRNYDNRDVLDVEAKVAGAWGNGIRLQIDYNTSNFGETFNLTVMEESGGKVVNSEYFANLSMDISSNRYAPTFVTQSSGLISVTLDSSGLGDPTLGTSVYQTGSFAGFSEARRPLGKDLPEVLNTLEGLLAPAPPASPSTSFDINVNDAGWVSVNLSGMSTNQADYVGGIPDVAAEIQTRVNNALQSLVPAPTVVVTLTAVAAPTTPIDGQHMLRLTANNLSAKTVRVRRAPLADIASSLMMGADNGGVEMAKYSNFRPSASGCVVRFEAAGSLASLNAIAALKQNLNDMTGVNIAGVNVALALNTVPAANAGWFKDAITGSPNGNNDGVRQKLRLIAQAITNEPTSLYKAEVHGYYLVLTAKNGSLNEVPNPAIVFSGTAAGTAAFSGPLKVNTRQYTLGPGSTSAYFDNGLVKNGDDGTAPQFSDYVGNTNDQTGFHVLDPLDLFNLMILPADAELTDTQRQQLWGAACAYCASHRAFLIIDAPDSWTTNDYRPAVLQNISLVNDLRTTVVKDYSAVFYPKIKINDGGVIKSVGASGSIAGLFSRIDASRGVWKAPAGIEADLRGVKDLEINMTDMENGVLNKLGINCLRKFPNGIVNWGARTLDGSDDFGSEWKYIPIRRLALFLEESLFRGTKWVVFEPNDEPLWAKIRMNINAFMMGLFRQGAFQGTTPDKAFFVKCDGETTTANDRNLGIVNIQVGFAPLKPAEFVIITIQQIPDV